LACWPCTWPGPPRARSSTGATRLLAEHTIRRLEARLLAGVGSADLGASPAGQPNALAQRLGISLDDAHADGERSLLQANIYAADGTVLFSGQPERVGRKVLPSRVPRLAGALAGAVNTRLLALSPVDDADLTARYTEVLAVYSPIQRDGQIVAAAEVYADPTPVRLARLATWLVIVGPVTLGLLLYVRRRQDEQAEQVDRLIDEAFFDSLTGLANRALFRFSLQQAFSRAGRRSDLLAVMFLDLDRFKSINDTLGHAAGDQLLVMVGERLLKSVRPEDTVSRLAGDEFTVLMEDVPSLDDACAVAQRILDAMRRPFILAGEARTVRVSLGIAARTVEHREPEDVLHDADQALYQAKAGGRDRYVVFDPSLASSDVKGA
jgi:diguanylate cyclase (GGDEF)-like protein